MFLCGLWQHLQPRLDELKAVYQSIVPLLPKHASGSDNDWGVVDGDRLEEKPPG